MCTLSPSPDSTEAEFVAVTASLVADFCNHPAIESSSAPSSVSIPIIHAVDTRCIALICSKTMNANLHVPNPFLLVAISFSLKKNTANIFSAGIEIKLYENNTHSKYMHNDNNIQIISTYYKSSNYILNENNIKIISTDYKSSNYILNENNVKIISANNKSPNYGTKSSYISERIHRELWVSYSLYNYGERRT